MPLIRRIPKRGFNNAEFTTAYSPVNVSSLTCLKTARAWMKRPCVPLAWPMVPCSASRFSHRRADQETGRGRQRHQRLGENEIEAKGGSVEIIAKKSAAPAKKYRADNVSLHRQHLGNCFKIRS